MKTSPFDNVPNSELIHCIDEWVKNERNRSIMKRRLVDGICFERLAEEYDLSPRQVKYIVNGECPLIASKLHL